MSRTITVSPLTLTALPLRITARVTNPILLNEHKGSAIRGALFGALRRRSCARLDLSTCHLCELVPVCPISALVATVDPAWDRGADPPRPLVIDPPLDQRTDYAAGDCFDFGLTVLGSAGRLLPYLVLALSDAGKAGLGRRYQRDGLWTRGRFEIRRVDLVNPFSEMTGPAALDRKSGTLPAGEETSRPCSAHPEIIETLYPAAGPNEARALFRSPRSPLTSQDLVQALNGREACTEISLDFRTPTRLVRKGEMLRQFDLLTFLRRLRERLEALEMRYGQPDETQRPTAGALTLPPPTRVEESPPVQPRQSEPSPTSSEAAYLFQAAGLADRLDVIRDNTHWQEVRGYSTRQKQAVPLSGFTGRVTLRGDVGPLLPYLAWGQLTHVGKDATKGNGLYRIKSLAPALP